MVCRKAALHVFQFEFLMHIDEHSAVESFEKPGAPNFVRLKNHVPIRKDYWLAQAPGVLNCIERVWEQAVGKRVLQKEVRHSEQVRVAWIMCAIELQRP